MKLAIIPARGGSQRIPRKKTALAKAISEVLADVELCGIWPMNLGH